MTSFFVDKKSVKNTKTFESINVGDFFITPYNNILCCKISDKDNMALQFNNGDDDEEDRPRTIFVLPTTAVLYVEYVEMTYYLEDQQ